MSSSGIGQQDCVSVSQRKSFVFCRSAVTRQTPPLPATFGVTPIRNFEFLKTRRLPSPVMGEKFFSKVSIRVAIRLPRIPYTESPRRCRSFGARKARGGVGASAREKKNRLKKKILRIHGVSPEDLTGAPTAAYFECSCVASLSKLQSYRATRLRQYLSTKVLRAPLKRDDTSGPPPSSDFRRVTPIRNFEFLNTGTRTFSVRFTGSSYSCVLHMYLSDTSV